MTTRGFKEAEVTTLAGWMCDILDDVTNEATIARVKGLVIELNTKFPVYA